MNIRLLKAKMVEHDYTIDKLAKLLNLNPMTIRLKMKGDGFKVNEARAIMRALKLNRTETCEIFFTDD